MTIGIRSTATATTPSSAFSLDVPMPSGAAQGDVVVVSLALGNSSMSGVTASSGWTKVAETGGAGFNRLAVFWRIMPASPPSSVHLDWTPGGIAGSGSAVAVAYTGVNNASVIDGGGSSWDSSGTTASLTTGHASSRLVLCTSNTAVATAPTSYTKEVENSSGGAVATLFDLNAGSAGAYSVVTTTNESVFLALNAQAPPLAPTLTTPINASYQDLAAGITFGWTYNPATSSVSQTAYALRRKIGAGAYEWWNAGTLAWQGTEIFNTSSVSSVAFATSKWANGTTYNWSVNTQDSNGTGTYSADNTVTGSVAPTATVTGPTGTVAGASPSVSWTETVQAGASQIAYRVVIESGAYGTTPGSGATAWDSGVVGSAALTVIAGTALANATSYRVFVQVTETGGQVSSWSFSTFTVTYDTPNTPSIVAVWDSTLARCVLAVQGRDNLLTANQSSLETDTTGWNAGANTTIARSTAQSLDGTASLALTAVGSGQIGANTNTLAVKAGNVYTATASLRAAATARAVGVAINWYDASVTFISQTLGNLGADNASGWQQSKVTGQAPANAALATVQPFANGAVATEVHYVDRIGLFPDPFGNLVANPDFESGTTGWTNGSGGTFWLNAGATLTQDTAQAYTGRSAGKVVTTATVSEGIESTTACVPNATYTLSARVFIQSAATIQLGIRGTTTGVSATSTVSTTGSWQTITVTVTVGATDTTLSYSLRTTTAVAITFWVDAVQVVVGSTAQPYVPPSVSNLVTNPSFEVDVSGWSVGTRIVLSRDTARFYIGAASGKLTLTAGATDVIVMPISVQAGVPLTVQYRAYVPSSTTAGTGGVYMDITGPDAFDGPNVGADMSIRDQWQMVMGTMTPTASGVANLRMVTTGSAVGVMWVDAIQVEFGSVANPYVDGAQGPGYSWDASSNLLTAEQSSFEGGTTGGWSTIGTGTTIANSATRAQNGTKSLLVTLGAGAAGTMGASITLTLPPNATHTYSTYVYLPSGSVASTELVVSGTGVTAIGNVAVTTTNSFVRQVVTFTTNATGGTVTFWVLNGAASTAGQTFFIDAVQVEQRSYATPYAQAGTANAATSTYQAPWTIGGFASIGSYIIEASEDSGTTWKAVRGGPFTVDSGANQQFTVYDYERTPGATVLYRARVSDVSAGTTVTSLNSSTSSCVVSITSWWVKDITNPALNKAICDAQQHVRNRKGDSAAVYPAGRTNPVVLRGPVHGADGQMRTIVSTEADRTAILNLFTAQASMLLQDPRGRQWYVEWVGDLTETQMQTDPTQPNYAIQRNWVEVDVPS